MVSNRLTHRRTTISNPKICKSKLKPLRPLPPEEPPEWPPPYINARIIALLPGQHFEATLTLEPRNRTPDAITYHQYHPTLLLSAEVILFHTQNPNCIIFSHVVSYTPYFYAGYGPTVTVQPPTFELQNSLWRSNYPYDAQITMAIAYPGEP